MMLLYIRYLFVGREQHGRRGGTAGAGDGGGAGAALRQPGDLPPHLQHPHLAPPHQPGRQGPPHGEHRSLNIRKQRSKERAVLRIQSILAF